MGRCRHGHVVRELHGVIPLEIPIQNGRPEPDGSVLLGILVDSFNSSEKILSIAKERAVMVVAMQVHFAATRTKEVQKSLRNLVAFFRNDLIGGFDSKRSVDFN